MLDISNTQYYGELFIMIVLNDYLGHIHGDGNIAYAGKSAYGIRQGKLSIR